MAYLGDLRLGDTLDLKFCTVTTTGAPTQLAGSPVMSAYPGNSTTQLTAGITLTVDFDGVTGLNHVRVVASNGNGYATATNYQLVITVGTVGGTSVVGYVVGDFSIENRSAVMPTTAARTLDVSATGEAGVDWANVGSPTTSLALTGTTLGLTAASITAIWNELVAGHTTPGTFGQLGLVPRANTATAGAAGTITLDASASAVDSFYNDQIVVITSGTGVGQARQITAYVGSTKVATIAPNWATNPANGSVFVILPAGAANSVATIAGAVWDIVLASHVTAGSTGAALNAAGGAGDPWITALPGAYAAGSAGKIVGDNINATISSRSTAAALATVQADTDDIQTRLPAALVSGRIDASVGAMAANTLTASALAADAVDEILDDPIGDGTITMRQALRVLLAASAAKTSGGATTTFTIRNVADSANVIVATVDANGNRTAVTVTP